MKQLLLEYRPFTVSKEQIAESLGTSGNGSLVVRGVLQRANSKNQNGRIYPKAVLERECAKYIENEVKLRKATGELDHPDSQIVNLRNVSHLITEMWWEGDDLMGKIEVLNTPSGNILKSLFEHGVTLGISSRGMGSTKTLSEENAVEVQSDFELVTFDFVSNPSTHGAYMSPVNEGVQSPQSEYDVVLTRTHQLVTEIICDLSNKVIL